MKVVSLKRRTRAEVIANLISTGMSYTDALREYDRLDQEDFMRRFAHILNDDWLSLTRI